MRVWEALTPALSSVVSGLRVNKKIPTREGWMRGRGLGEGEVSFLKEQKVKENIQGRV